MRASLDPEILDAALRAEAGGAPLSFDDLSRRFPGREAAILAVIDALTIYQAEVQQERRQRRPAPVGAAQGPGRRLGDFRIEGELGRGAMGVVYRARQLSLGERVVALKVLPPELVARDARFLERFRREAALAATVHHANLAEVYGSGEADGNVFFAMRLVEGPTLQVAMHAMAGSGQRPRVQSAVRIARDLAAALAAIHERGLVHRDVKPANVILEDVDGGGLDTARPVLVDFSPLRASGASELTGARTRLGAPACASPECQLGREVDARAAALALRTVYDNRALAARTPGLRVGRDLADRYWDASSRWAGIVQQLGNDTPEALQIAHDRLHDRSSAGSSS